MNNKILSKPELINLPKIYFELIFLKMKNIFVSSKNLSFPFFATFFELTG